MRPAFCSGEERGLISEQRLVTEPSLKARQSEMMRERRFRKSEHARGLLAPA